MLLGATVLTLASQPVGELFHWPVERPVVVRGPGDVAVHHDLPVESVGAVAIAQDASSDLAFVQQCLKLLGRNHCASSALSPVQAMAASSTSSGNPIEDGLAVVVVLIRVGWREHRTPAPDRGPVLLDQLQRELTGTPGLETLGHRYEDFPHAPGLHGEELTAR